MGKNFLEELEGKGQTIKIFSYFIGPSQRFKNGRC